MSTSASVSLRGQLGVAACALLLAGCNLPPGETASPQRPTFCISPATTAAGTWEVEAGAVVQPGDYWELPTTWKYGYDEHTELSIGVSPLITVDDNTGFGDTSFGWRHRFVDADGAAPAVAWLASVKAPTADSSRGLGSGHVDGSGGLTVSGSLGSFTWYALAQLDELGEQGEGADLQRDYALMGEWAVDDTNAFYAEYSDRYTHETGSHIGQVRVGHYITLRPDFVVDWGLYLPANHDAPDTQFVAGFTRNLGAGRHAP